MKRPFPFHRPGLCLLLLLLSGFAAATAAWGQTVITLDVGFSRYRVLLYNTSGSSASVAFFAYRSRH